jgi:GntR family transcriptional regulator/MocR family aminotransferase
MGGRSGVGSDFLQLRPAQAPPKGLTSWLADAIRSAIMDGRLRAGQLLPATRVLAHELRISRGVVTEAYARLADQGLVSGRTGVGTVVTPWAVPPRRNAAPAADRPLGMGPLAPLLPLATYPLQAAIDLSPGLPDLSAFPRGAWLRAERDVLTHAHASDLGYGDPRGLPPLRAELSGWLARNRGMSVTAADVIVVAGVAQSLALLAQHLVSSGTTSVAVEDPGSRGARDELNHWGLQTVPVCVDDDGLNVDELAASGLEAVVVTPAHQYPTGVVLGPSRRQALLRWAATTDALVVEDDYDAEHRYDRAPVAALQGSAPDRVAYTGSISKSLAPAMRLGWLVPPRPRYADLVAAKHASDLGSPAIPQLVLARLIATGELDRHLRLVRRRHHARRDTILAGLRQHLPQCRVQGVAAGLHVLITVPELAAGADDIDLAERIRQHGVLVHPLSWHRQRPGPPGLVIGYGANPAHRLRDAAERIGRAARAMLPRGVRA